MVTDGFLHLLRVTLEVKLVFNNYALNSENNSKKSSVISVKENFDNYQANRENSSFLFYHWVKNLNKHIVDNTKKCIYNTFDRPKWLAQENLDALTKL